MQYNINMNEYLVFIKELFERSSVPVRLITEETQIADVDMNFQKTILHKVNNIKILPDNPSYDTIYEISDSLDACWLAYPDILEHCFLLAGPFLVASVDVPLMIQSLQELNTPKNAVPLVIQYLTTIPVINDDVMLYHINELIGEKVYGSARFEQVVHGIRMPSASADVKFTESTESENKILQRYKFEDKIIQAIRNGDEEAIQNIKNLSIIQPERRTSNRLRNDKNYIVILHSYARKAAQQAGVNPVVIDMISRSHAVRIENAQSFTALRMESDAMIHDYCSAVQKFRTAGYSSLVASAIDYISTHMEEEITLSRCAKAIGVSHYYLSSRFHEETGNAFTDYVQKVKIKAAAEDLLNTKKNTADIAAQYGFSNPSYFTRVFKKVMGESPAAYRKKAHSA